MARYIDVDKVTYNKIRKSILTDDLTERELKMIIQVFHSLPAENVKPIIRGEWICANESCAICNKCNRLNQMYGDFCKYCGADMRNDRKSVTLNIVKVNKHKSDFTDLYEDKNIEMRDATPEEQKSVNDYVDSISKPTGINFYKEE